MASEKSAAVDAMEAKVAGPVEKIQAIDMHADVACWEKDVNGNPVQVWKARADNAVVREGIAMLGNVGLFGQRVTTNGPFLVLHNAAYNSTHNWGALSASQVSGYSASLLIPAFSTTNATAGSWTATNSMSFTIAGTQTVSGAGLVFYTSAAIQTNPVNSSDVKLYNIGSFTAAQQVQSNNTLSITMTLSVGTV